MARVKVQREDEPTIRTVRLMGLTDIMFDRYAGDNTTQLEPWQKLYLDPKDSKTIALPALNVHSFLSAHNTNSAPKRLYDKRKYKDVANAALAFVSISPMLIPFTRKGEALVFGKLEGSVDPSSGVYIHAGVARLDKGIPNPKVRPVLPVDWELTFTLTLMPNKEITEQQLINLFDQGGVAVGLGTFRGVFGKFKVDLWE